jgi:antirestriction protein ArdC
MLSSAGYTSPYWLTFKQAKEIGGSVRKGEHGFPVVFWKWLEGTRESEDGEEIVSELAPKIHATTMDRGFRSLVTTIFCIKE